MSSEPAKAGDLVEQVIVEAGLHDGGLDAVDGDGGGDLDDGGDGGDAAAERAEEFAVGFGEGLAAAEVDHPEAGGDESAD